MTEKPKLHPIETALADLFARDIAREMAEGRPDNAKAIASMLGSEPPPPDVRVITE